MWKPSVLKQLTLLPGWPVSSQQVARRNALVASTALAHRRRQRLEVEDFLDRLDRDGGVPRQRIG